MPGKTRFLLLLSAFLLTMCRAYAAQPIPYGNGLQCRNYTEYRFFEPSVQGASCTYTCPDGTEKETDVSGTISSVYGSSKEELDAQFCGIAFEPTPEQPPATVSPTPTSDASPTPAATSTRIASPSPTLTLTSAVLDPLLMETVSMCDLGGKLINFRIVQPPPDLAGRDLRVEIADQETPCYVNPTNPSLLTCRIPSEVSFPARVVVSLDGAMVNDFEYSGLGCSVLTTPTPGPRPSYP